MASKSRNLKANILVTLIFSLVLVSGTTAQVDQGLIAYYSFDACDATDDTGQMADGVISGNPDCVCGVFNNALLLDGQNDFIEFLGNFDVAFTDVGKHEGGSAARRIDVRRIGRKPIGCASLQREQIVRG